MDSEEAVFEDVAVVYCQMEPGVPIRPRSLAVKTCSFFLGTTRVMCIILDSSGYLVRLDVIGHFANSANSVAAARGSFSNAGTL